MKEVVGVRFKGNGKIYYFSPGNLKINKDDVVIVNTDKGLQLGEVATNIKNIKKENLILPVKKALRIANEEDKKAHQKNIRDSEMAHKKCQKLIEEYNLNMKLLETVYTFDRKQLIFYFTSEDRIDFRSLVKDLAKIYKTRIELRQVGIRDQAKSVGGLGHCGRELCCTAFLNEFDSVSINMAKNQNLALNPAKISGVCGRLLCCLNYENKEYKEYKKGIPPVGTIVKTNQGKGKVISVDVFNRRYKVDVPDYGVVNVETQEEKDGSN
ncbi:MAG: stage 0 sporulation family protein [Bacilli bacterium]